MYCIVANTLYTTVGAWHALTHTYTHTHGAVLSNCDSADQQEQIDVASHNPFMQKK